MVLKQKGRTQWFVLKSVFITIPIAVVNLRASEFAHLIDLSVPNCGIAAAIILQLSTA